MTSLVSIVVPSFNQAAYLDDALRSVLDQDYDRLEVVVVDGGSTDGSVEIIRRHADRLAWWTSGPDAGQAAALNTGFAHAQGEYLGWLNSDDLMHPGAVLSAVTALAAAPDALLAYGAVEMIDERSRVVATIDGPVVDLRQMVERCHYAVNQQGSLFRRDALETAGGFDESSHYLFDAQFIVRLALAGRLLRLDQVLGAYRLHDESKTNVASREKAEDFVRLYDDVLPSLDLPRAVRDVVPDGRVRAYLWASELFYGAGDLASARRLALRAVRMKPGYAFGRLAPLFGRLLLPAALVRRLRASRRPVAT